MKNSVFNLKSQQENLTSKIVVAFERISDAHRALLWNQAKVLGISPIQIQILIFVTYHQDKMCTVSHLAKEFNITKPTISDSVKVLAKKELIVKETVPTDTRSYIITITPKGKRLVNKVETFVNPFRSIINKLSDERQSELYDNLSKMLFDLQISNVLQVQRICYSCQHYTEAANEEKDYCKFYKIELDKPDDIRVDCPGYRN